MQQLPQPGDARIVVEVVFSDGLGGTGVAGEFRGRVRHPLGGIAVGY